MIQLHDPADGSLLFVDRVYGELDRIEQRCLDLVAAVAAEFEADDVSLSATFYGDVHKAEVLVVLPPWPLGCVAPDGWSTSYFVTWEVLRDESIPAPEIVARDLRREFERMIEAGA